MSKKLLRDELRQTLAAIPHEQLIERSAAACRRFIAQPEYARAEILMVFLSAAHEVDTSHLALQAWADMKRVLVPKVSWDQRRILPIEIRSLTGDVADGFMGIREPVDGLPIPVADIDVVVVPGLGFDLQGNRLGRGRGFYDRFLSHRDFRAVSCGLALEEQVVKNVPTGETDMRVHLLVTDERVVRFK
ncbi:MAG: 5-formyltetrahydrofolate cyclo-ligase [Phycisphaerae bacterium]